MHHSTNTSLTSDEWWLGLKHVELHIEWGQIIVVLCCISFIWRTEVKGHLRCCTWLSSNLNCVLFERILIAVEVLAELEWNLNRQSLVISSQRSDFIRKLLECYIFREVNESRVIYILRYVDWLELDLACWIKIFTIPMIDECTDDILVLSEKAT